MQYIWKGMLSSFPAGQASAKSHSRLSKCALIPSPWMYFGQKRCFLIIADVYKPFFLNLMIPFSTQNPPSRVIILADPQIEFEGQSNGPIVFPPRSSNSWCCRDWGESFTSTISIANMIPVLPQQNCIHFKMTKTFGEQTWIQDRYACLSM